MKKATVQSYFTVKWGKRHVVLWKTEKDSVCIAYSHFYKNTEAQITQKLRTITRLDARTQKNFKGEK